MSKLNWVSSQSIALNSIERIQFERIQLHKDNAQLNEFNCTNITLNWTNQEFWITCFLVQFRLENYSIHMLPVYGWVTKLCRESNQLTFNDTPGWKLSNKIVSRFLSNKQHSLHILFHVVIYPFLFSIL